MNRKKHVLKKIDVTQGLGLELGPLYSPIVTKDEGRIFYVDHMSTKDLRKKYEGHGFDTKKIVDVDYVIGNKTLKQTLKNRKFDYVIASHVIEHLPNMVAWLEEIASVLKPGGILSLAIPDKRYTFDISRKLSQPSEVIGAYVDGVTRATSSMIYDAVSEFKSVDPVRAWSGQVEDILKKPTQKQMLHAWETMQLNLDPKQYVDAHYFTFTPASFIDIIKHLMVHKLISFEIIYFKDTAHNELEFYVSLRKIKGKRNTKEQLSTLPRIAPNPLRRSQNEIAKDNEIDKLKNKLEQLNKELEQLYSSRSWKVTKPIREASLINKRIRNRLKI